MGAFFKAINRGKATRNVHLFRGKILNEGEFNLDA